ncbi:DotD/TraH family lipoprotein [Acetobacter sacchari]|uniref:DotD/TraH family lipoprotein n=1 Tax=Acetobacter sacchari TaxID=2661687 RepID=A0ABS3LW83_9PROT|nr:DotD/TraH family lipoprotein [Acetobacter sacchari]MBO1360162.1 DotD/TraH family lipoprotein [Acetobacter sacchari]
MKPIPILLAIVSAGLSACSAHVDPAPIETAGMPSPELALQRSVASTTSDLRELGTMRASPPANVLAQNKTPDDINRQIWFVWKGPLNAGVRKLGKEIGYTVTVFGRSHDVPVQTNGVNSVLDILRSLGDQAGDAAAVQVDTLHHQIAVVYHA